jgi:hypothetical protein
VKAEDQKARRSTALAIPSSRLGSKSPPHHSVSPVGAHPALHHGDSRVGVSRLDNNANAKIMIFDDSKLNLSGGDDDDESKV